MQLDCPPAVQTSPNMSVINRLFASWHPPIESGTLRLEEMNPGRTRLSFEGENGARHLWFYGPAFDSALLGNPTRRRELARITKGFLKEASLALCSLARKRRPLLD
jgi:hypothetical protein